MSVTKDDRIALDRYLDKLRHIQISNHVNLNESLKEKRERIERCKKDYAFFVSYYFPHYAKCESAEFHIDAANQIKKNKFITSVEEWARGHAKSTHFDIMIPFWLWINDDMKVMLLIGKSEEDAKTLLSDLQAEFEANPQILADYGEQMSFGKWEEGNFVTKNGTAFFSLGRGQSPRGLRYRENRPDYIVCDDIDDDQLVKNPKRVKEIVNWILEAVMGTMDDGAGRFVLVNNRIGTNTVLTNLVKRPHVKHRVINAVDKQGKPSWHQKYKLEHFDRIREERGSYAFNKEYMNDPQVEGEIFKDEQIVFVPMPRIDSFDCIVGTWDVAYAGTSNGDFNAVKIWGLKDNNFYHLKAFVKQCKMADAVRFMIDYERSLPNSVIIHWRFESQFWNDALKMSVKEVCAEMKHQLNLTQCERPVKNKFDRIVSLQPHYQNTRVFYNIKEQYNPDMQAGIGQLKSIEPGYKTHDDAPDADEMAITYLSKFIQSNNPLPTVGMRTSRNSAW